jgi:hypothetical protein
MSTRSLNASQKTKHTPAGEIPLDWGHSLKAVFTALKSLAKEQSRMSGIRLG